MRRRQGGREMYYKTVELVARDTTTDTAFNGVSRMAAKYI